MKKSLLLLLANASLLPTLLVLLVFLTTFKVEALALTMPLTSSSRTLPVQHGIIILSQSASSADRCGRVVMAARRKNDRYSATDDDDEDDHDDQYYYNNEEDYYEDKRVEQGEGRRRPRRKKMDIGRRNGGLDENNLEISSPFGMPKGVRLPQPVSQALLAGVFVLGIGTGVTVDSQINTSPKDLASRDAVDQAAPNPRICSTYGASAMAFDQRVFVSFNPFNVYVAQADVKPACVLRESNVVSVLQDRGLINSKEVRACKQNMNTWAYVGDLNDYPQLSCVYKSEDAQNEFLSNPKYGIGEDVWDDDREVMEAVVKKSTSKKIKDGMTEGEKVVYEKALKLKKDAAATAAAASSDS